LIISAFLVGLFEGIFETDSIEFGSTPMLIRWLITTIVIFVLIKASDSIEDQKKHIDDPK